MGRGSSKLAGGSRSATEDNMNIPFDDWGKMMDAQPIRDEDGTIIGEIEDVTRYVSEPNFRSVTKKDVLDYINDNRFDNGTYGDNDVQIYLAYKDGTVVDVNSLNGKAYKKTGIVGASISTPEDEMVWGGEIGRNGQFRPWRTWSEDGESGRTNSYSGYKTTGRYIVRVKTTYNNPNGRGGYRTKREIIRQSVIKPYN